MDTCKLHIIFLYLQCVFHSIRFKVNKGGVQRYSFFLCLSSSTPFVFYKKPTSPDEKPTNPDENPTSSDENPTSSDEEPATPGRNDQFAPGRRTRPSCALAQRQTYPISPPSCTKDRHGPPFYSSQEENTGARKRKDKYIGDRWREIPPTLKASAENADRPLLAKLPIEFPAQDESVEDAATRGDHVGDALRGRVVGLGSVEQLRPQGLYTFVILGDVLQQLRLPLAQFCERVVVGALVLIGSHAISTLKCWPGNGPMAAR